MNGEDRQKSKASAP
ncbi:hypothetical protein YPPY66_1211, partial [Yersinia pestis PY-66]